WIDVSLPTASIEFLNELYRAARPTPYVIGCTGWTEAQMTSVHRHAEKAPTVMSPNFSPGVTLFLGLIAKAAPILEKWGYSAVIHETHHTKKLDAPSGTAKAMAAHLSKMKHEVHSTRAGLIVGTHEARFFGPGDIISFTHEALDRSIFARGAILAAQWAASHR